MIVATSILTTIFNHELSEKKHSRHRLVELKIYLLEINTGYPKDYYTVNAFSTSL